MKKQIQDSNQSKEWNKKSILQCIKFHCVLFRNVWGNKETGDKTINFYRTKFFLFPFGRFALKEYALSIPMDFIGYLLWDLGCQWIIEIMQRKQYFIILALFNMFHRICNEMITLPRIKSTRCFGYFYLLFSTNSHPFALKCWKRFFFESFVCA